MTNSRNPLLSFALAALITLTACAGATSRGVQPPPLVSVAIQPTTASLFLGQTQQFTPTVTGSSNTSVTWSVNSISGGNSTLGTITSAGLYTAPATLPSNSSVTITAVSVADSQASASAIVSLKDDIAVSVSPPTATVPVQSAQLFTASVTASGNPATGVTWSVNGISGGNSTVGTIAATGNDSATYTAPSVPPSPATVTIAATSVADATKSGTASVTVTCSANSLAPPSASVSLAQSQTFTASFCGATAGAISWDVNGVSGGNSTLGTITSNGATTALYTAPSDLPPSNPVSIHATQGASVVEASVTITSSVTVSVSPPFVTLVVSQRLAFTPTVTGTPDAAVTWTVNGVPNGNPTAGEICLTGSNPCVSPNGAQAGSIDYIAPASVPAANPVTIAATSRADSSQSGAALVTIASQSGPISVAVSPSYAFVPPSTGTPSTLQFSATVTGTGSPSVTWTVQSAVSGQGCGGAACGSVNSAGLYTAPNSVPSPNAIAVTATSVADSTKSASATVAISSGPTIEALLPSSVMAGAVEAFPFEVKGANFVAGSGSSASVILFNGAARATTCATTAACTTSLNPADVQSAATVTIQIQNPGAPGLLSNPVPFVIVPFDVSVASLSLTQSQPVASSANITVVEPTTAAASSPINVDFIGLLTGGNTCGVQGSPLTVTRPASGSQVVSLCVHGNGLDPTFSYVFTGPPGGDIPVVASAVTGLFPNMIELDLTLSATTLPGIRALFITTPNNDAAVATGMLEVK
ncbi:MAG TPA: hypothetical protein VMH00_09635 [Candidatus Limnocylindrales bacterium]|nr:hypothetical protein [Candidatus Limnocylindrales bacterium]